MTQRILRAACEPITAGRFKKNGDKCEWSATDSGRNQCDPRNAK